MSAFGEIALHHGRGLGYPVFSLRPREKIPYPGSKGFHDATTDAAAIAAMWHGHPDANVGLYPGGAGGFIVDIDPKYGIDPEDFIGDHELDRDDLVIVWTGEAPERNAKYPNSLPGVIGAHLHFKGERDTFETTITGVGVRGVGGYGLAPGSIHPCGLAYRGELPLLAELPSPPEAILALKPKVSASEIPADGEEFPSPGRHEALLAWSRSRFTAHGVLGEPALLGMQAKNAVACKPPLPDSEVRRLWKHLEGTRIASGERARADAPAPSFLRPQSRNGDEAAADLDGRPQLGELLEAVEGFVRRFVVLGDHEAVALVLWIAHSHAFEGAHCTPYLVFSSAAKRAGKTRAFEVVELLVRQPWRTVSTSEAALFRKIDSDRPTLLLDEVDAIFNGSSERHEPLRAILNAGNRPGSTATRCVGPQQQLAEFTVFCPKALAGINASKWPDTVLDRSIRIDMRRAAKGDRRERFYRRFAEAEADQPRTHLAEWAAGAVEGLLQARPAGLLVLDDRAAEAWEPLLAIAEMAGGDWPVRARKAAQELSADPDDDSTAIVALAAIREAFNAADKAAKKDNEDAKVEALASASICAALNGDDELPFGGWRKGEGIDGRGLARVLKPFGVRPKTVRVDETTAKGYEVEPFEEVFERWL